MHPTVHKQPLLPCVWPSKCFGKYSSKDKMQNNIYSHKVLTQYNGFQSNQLVGRKKKIRYICWFYQIKPRGQYLQLRGKFDGGNM